MWKRKKISLLPTSVMWDHRPLRKLSKRVSGDHHLFLSSVSSLSHPHPLQDLRAVIDGEQREGGWGRRSQVKSWQQQESKPKWALQMLGCIYNYSKCRGGEICVQDVKYWLLINATWSPKLPSWSPEPPVLHKMSWILNGQASPLILVRMDLRWQLWSQSAWTGWLWKVQAETWLGHPLSPR